jgi:PPOX class probable F420-dependent enzyme
MREEALRSLLASTNGGVLVTLKRDGRPQLSNVGHTYDPATDLLRVSVREPLAKTKNLRRDPRASYHVTTPNFRSWVVGEGLAELTPVAADPHDDTVEELIDVYRSIAGEHPDWDDYRSAMVREARVVVKLPITHVYGTA